MQKYDFTLVLACYNEASHLEESFKNILISLDSTKYKYEIIFIDDKSQDKTPDIIKKLVKGHKNISAYYHKKNLGRGGTVSEGIRLAKAPVVGFIDIDLEVSADYIPHFVRAIISGEADIAVAHRYYPSYFFPISIFIRMVLSKGYVQLGRKFLDLPVEDTEAGYKFFNTAKILPVLSETQNKHWFWDTEIVARSLYSGLKLKQIPTLFLKKPEKASTVKLIPDTIHFIKSIYRFRKTIAAEKPQAPGMLYRSVSLYQFTIERLFGTNYENRYKAIVKLIPQNATVVDVCCGDGKLYEYVKSKTRNYVGLDLSLPFIRHILKKHVRAIHSDITVDPIPNGDIVVMQGSLYQFDNPRKLLDKLFKSAKDTLIISESVINLDKGILYKLPYMEALSTKLVGTNKEDHNFRYNTSTFKKLLSKYHPQYIEVKGGRDLIAIISK